MEHKQDLQNNRIAEGISGKSKKSFKAPKINKKWALIIAGIVVLLIIIAVALVLLLPKGSDGNDVSSTDGTYTAGTEITDEEKAVTKKVLDEYAEVTVVGFQEFEDENGKHNSIVVNVKNVSDKRISLAIDVIAKNKEGAVLDKSSLYAEGIMPEQTQVFQTFVYSTLSADELKAADYEVLKAYTYVAPGDSENNDNQEVQQTTDVVETETSQDESQSEPVAEPETETETETENETNIDEQ